MKNVIKRISATAMAFALLGAGTTIAKNVSPESFSTFTAYAAHENIDNQWQRLNVEPCKEIKITHTNGKVEYYKYSSMTVYRNKNNRQTIKISINSIPGHPVTVYCFDVKKIKLTY